MVNNHYNLLTITKMSLYIIDNQNNIKVTNDYKLNVNRWQSVRMEPTPLGG